MSIPTKGECLMVMDQTHMPAHIRKHSMMVARASLYLGELLNRNSSRLDLHLLEAAALLHGIAKMQSIETGGSHSEMGAKMVADLGYLALAPIVRDHVTMDTERVRGPVTESVLVNYCDKRVKHDQIVNIKDRFDDLIARYAKTEASLKFLREKYVLYVELEKRIFDHLNIDPNGAEFMGLSLGKTS
jgi:uncharacterized protein